MVKKLKLQNERAKQPTNTDNTLHYPSIAGRIFVYCALQHKGCLCKKRNFVQNIYCTNHCNQCACTKDICVIHFYIQEMQEKLYVLVYMLHESSKILKFSRQILNKNIILILQDQSRMKEKNPPTLQTKPKCSLC